MKNVLLVGNGLNRCIKSKDNKDVSTKGLLNYITKKYLEEETNFYDCGKAFSLCFESLLGRVNIKANVVF